MIRFDLETLAYGVIGFGVTAGAGALIASDMAGADALAKVFRGAAAAFSRPAPKALDLSHFKEVTLFAKARVEGSDLEVHTGVEFASAEDLAAGRQTKRWCYVTVPGRSGFTRHITLGTQTGTSSPVYRDLARDSDGDALAGGLSIGALSAIARSHCRFSGQPVQPVQSKEKTRTASAADIGFVEP